MVLGRYHYNRSSDPPAAPPPPPPSEDYGAALLSIFPNPQFAYALESGSVSVEQTGNGAGSLTYFNSPTYVGPATNGPPAAGMSFNGTDEYGSASNHATYNVGTNDFWLHFLMNQGGSWPASTQFVFDHNGDGGSGSWDFQLLSSNRIAVRLVNNSTVATTLLVTLAGVPSSGWHQYIFTCDRDSATGGLYYFDGAQVGTAKDYTPSNGDSSQSSTFYVARRQTSGFLAGSLAWVAMGYGIPTPTNISDVYAEI